MHAMRKQYRNKTVAECSLLCLIIVQKYFYGTYVDIIKKNLVTVSILLPT